MHVDVVVVGLVEVKRQICYGAFPLGAFRPKAFSAGNKYTAWNNAHYVLANLFNTIAPN